MSQGEIELCVVGDFAWDVLIRTNTELLRGGDTFGEVMLMPGGSAANVAVWAARCGLPTHFIGKIGRDRMGQLADEDLAAEHVTGHLVESDAHSTGSVAVFVDHTGERSMVSGHGADFYLLPSELPRDVIAQSRHLHLTAWSFFTDPPRTSAAVAARHRAGLGRHALVRSRLVPDDPGDGRRPLHRRHPRPRHRRLPPQQGGGRRSSPGSKDPEAIARDLTEIYEGSLVILKLDADGALVWLDGAAHHIPPATNNLVDATGAGDSFAGALPRPAPGGHGAARGGDVRDERLGVGHRASRGAARRSTRAPRA